MRSGSGPEARNDGHNNERSRANRDAEVGLCRAGFDSEVEDGTAADVSSEEEQGQPDKAGDAFLPGGAQVVPALREVEEDDDRGADLDCAIDAESDEDDATGGDAGDDREDAFEQVVGDDRCFEEHGLADETGAADRVSLAAMSYSSMGVRNQLGGVGVAGGLAGDAGLL